MTGREKICLVTGTGTDAGKTVAAAALLRAAGRAGMPVRGIKPIQTGCVTLPGGSLLAPDAAVYAEACPDAAVQVMHAYAEPCSPHLAARMAGETLSARALADAVRAAAADGVFTVVEGAGGILVPVNESETMLDFAALLRPRIVLVCGNYLGAVNHALLSIEALRSRDLFPDLILVNAAAPAASPREQAIQQDNPAIIAKLSGASVLQMPFIPDIAAEDPARRENGWETASRQLAGSIAGLAGSRTAERGLRNDAVLAADARRLWHPYAPAVPAPQVWAVRRTAGTRIVLEDGRELVDGMASWWAAVFGYNHPALTAAVREQAARMPHVMFGGLTHEPAAALAEKLAALAPSGLDRVFFCDSGSVAAEASLKMALQYQAAAGRPEKNRIGSARGGYHGDTAGAMSVSDPDTGMHRLFTGILPRQLFFSRPEQPFSGSVCTEDFRPLEEFFGRHGHELAAVIIEPVVQGAGGMRMYHPEYLRVLRRLCSASGTLLIADEIAVGFGRTGKMFACEWAGITPDIMCVGKALTGGVMSLAAVLARENIAEVISSAGAFMHGPTYMANPLACAAAGASLDLLAAFPWKERAGQMEIRLRNGLQECAGLPGTADVRVLGSIAAVEMEAEVNVPRLQRFFVDDCGVWIRPFGRLIYIMPPYTAEPSELDRLCAAIVRAVREEKWR